VVGEHGVVEVEHVHSLGELAGLTREKATRS
jgi:hypothetical protein